MRHVPALGHLDSKPYTVMSVHEGNEAAGIRIAEPGYTWKHQLHYCQPAERNEENKNKNLPIVLLKT